MNKGELVAAVAQRAKLNKKEAEAAVDAVINVIKDTMKEEKITLVGFGTFGVKERAARTGINPQTGEKINIAASKVPFFKPGTELRKAVK
ncbi:MAG: HU family DNA-binding protein [bacterium]|jgi:DNA-binding protein HU-beta|nr:HU family DNA-binding protein [bacterium]MDD3804947.1 HU family DNA-binding protein [bacterium]MDD4558307.1 HU family DNA-binding protein [bacterium]